jgi:hypothetical protein
MGISLGKGMDRAIRERHERKEKEKKDDADRTRSIAVPSVLLFGCFPLFFRVFRVFRGSPARLPLLQYRARLRVDGDAAGQFGQHVEDQEQRAGVEHVVGLFFVVFAGLADLFKMKYVKAAVEFA